MFDLGWTELLVIGVVALIVVGPKDLPGMFRALGQFTAKMRRMAREFSRAMEEAADASGAKDIAKDLNSLKSMTSPRSAGASALKKAAGLDTLDDVFEDDDEGETPNTKPEPARGPATQKLTEERAEVARKIHEHSARKAQERLDAEAAAKEAAAAGSDAPAPDAPATKAGTPAATPAPAPETDKA